MGGICSIQAVVAAIADDYLVESAYGLISRVPLSYIKQGKING
jgi:hypothetical protein